MLHDLMGSPDEDSSPPLPPKEPVFLKTKMTISKTLDMPTVTYYHPKPLKSTLLVRSEVYAVLFLSIAVF